MYNRCAKGALSIYNHCPNGTKANFISSSCSRRTAVQGRVPLGESGIAAGY
ncbi:MAG: hypothetical protein WC197_02035 [Candidatus Gastranaerophilaceae bacterium]